MAFPAVTNVDGSNPGPNSSTLPDTVQSPVGNVWKIGAFSLTLSPTTIAPSTSAEQTFAMTGLLTTDVVYVSSQTPQAGLGIVGSRAKASDVLGITFGNLTAVSITITSGVVYTVSVLRVQPNWTAPATGSLIDW